MIEGVTDTDLRELERRFRASGSVEDEAAWLGARVQAGELTAEGLRLAACLGDPASQVATAGRTLSDALARLRELQHVEGLKEEAVARNDFETASAHRERAWSLRKRERQRDPYDRPSLCRGESSGLGPWSENLIHAHPQVGLRTGVALANAWRRRHRSEDLRLLRVLAAAEALAALGAPPDLSALGCLVGEERSTKVLDRPGGLAACLLRLCAEGPTPAAVGILSGMAQDCSSRRLQAVYLDEIRHELLPWALGHRDPVRERVEARMRDLSTEEKQ